MSPTTWGGGWQLEIRAMTRKQIIVKAIAGELTWIRAADILGMCAACAPVRD